AAAYQLVKRAPEAASASMLGVFRSFAPHAPMSWQPRSSARKMTKFGLRAGARVCAIALAARDADDRKSLRENMPDMLSHAVEMRVSEHDRRISQHDREIAAIRKLIVQG